MSDVIGKCPVCSSDLEERDSNLRCSKTPDHYSIRRDVYDGLWEKFEKSPRTMEDGDALLSGLLDNNQADDPPEIKKTVMVQLEEDLEKVAKEHSVVCVICGNTEYPLVTHAAMVEDGLVGGWYHQSHPKEEVERIIKARMGAKQEG